MINKLKILFLLILIYFSSCIDRNTSYKSIKGKKHFPAEKTCKIMFDLHKADAMVSTNILDINDKNKVKDTLIYDIVFDKYNCTRQEFYETLLFHIQNNIDSINYFYEKNIEKLLEEQSKIIE